MFTGINEFNRSLNYTSYTSVSLLTFIFLSYLPSRQFHGRFLTWCQNTRIDFNELLHETFSKFGEVLPAQEKVGS